MSKSAETDLYPPVKDLLEAQGYTVKSEIGAVDVMAVRGAEPPVIVELKRALSLSLFHQAIERLSVTDDVYVAVEFRTGKRFAKSVRQSVKLARRLGIGLMTVRLSDGFVEVHCDPGPYAPRKSAKKQNTLLREFARRTGDPNKGGQGRRGLVTTYRQDALKLALYLFEAGASRGADVAVSTAVPQATRMMRDNHYGWFEKIDTGVYGLTSKGAEAASECGDLLGG